MIKELVKKAKDFGNRIGFGITQEEILERKIKGEFFITINHANGEKEKHNFKNIIVDSASLLIARFLADGQTTLDPSGPAHGIWVLAVGTGAPGWDNLNPPAPTATQTILEAELARKRFSNVNFVKTDGSGLPATTITNILDFQTVFSESEAIGPIMEFGMFGGDADELVKDSGTLINYRTIAVINKPNTATMSIVFRITT